MRKTFFLMLLFLMVTQINNIAFDKFSSFAIGNYVKKELISSEIHGREVICNYLSRKEIPIYDEKEFHRKYLIIKTAKYSMVGVLWAINIAIAFFFSKLITKSNNR